MPDGPADRLFRVHARHVARHAARTLAEHSFEAAAVAYVEDYHDPDGGGLAIGVVVREIASGCERCFQIEPED